MPSRARLFLHAQTVVALFVTVHTTLLAGALGDYVRKQDDSFSWRISEKKMMDGLEVTTLDLTSQTWHGGRWTHTLYIARPPKLRNPDTAFLEITHEAGKHTLPRAKLLAERSGTLVAVVTDVPNQPLYDNKCEDALIAYTFEQYLKTGDETWPLLLPMVKSAVRAMDAVQAWALAERKQNVARFVVSGASKRGWTTWLTGAADKRVCGIAPIVIDMLNMKVQARWSQRVYGRQSEKINDYTELGLVEKMDLPAMVALRGIVDPYSYRDLFTMPKLILLGTNDPYWTVDALRNYWDGLPSPKMVYQAPNAGHGAGGTPDAIQTLAAFLQMMADRQTPPQMTWQLEGKGDASLTVTTDQPAKQARLWTAHSPTRDFRKAMWSDRPLTLDADGKRASAKVLHPVGGYTAFMAEMTFATTSGDTVYRLSTQVQVTPDL